MNTPFISVSGCRKTYGSLVAVDDVSFDVDDGEIFGLIGPNGAGKTTTMECVEGLRAPEGARSGLGLDPLRNAYRCRNESACSCSRRNCRSASRCGRPSICGPRSIANPRATANAARTARPREKREAWFMTLSGGQKQRLFIALALINDPEVVFTIRYRIYTAFVPKDGNAKIV